MNGPPTDATESGASRRGRLFIKYVTSLVGLVAVVLIGNGALDVWFSYKEAKQALVRIQQEKAESAAQRIAAFIEGIEQQIGWTTHAQWSAGTVDQRHFDYVRLLRQVPAITELVQLDSDGREQLKVSRLAMDAVGSNTDYSREPQFTEAVARKVWFSPIYFRKESEPYMTIAIAHVGKKPGVTVAEVNLKLIWDVVSNIKVGKEGYAYVVDPSGRLIAHPDISLVLRNTDLSRLPQVSSALAAPGAAAETDGSVTIAPNFAGASVLTAHADIPALNWRVFVELPASEAREPLYELLARSGILLGLALLLAAVAGGLLARRMVVPIQRLQLGAERLGRGELGHRIELKTGDEIEVLANRFNRMGAQLQESYATLEAKVEERTQELAEALEQQTATAEILRVINSSAGDLTPVFDAILQKAHSLCGIAYGSLQLYTDGRFHAVAVHGISEAFADRLRQGYTPGPNMPNQRLLAGERFAQVSDISEIDDPMAQAAAELGDIGTTLFIPLRKDARLLGQIVAARKEIRLFSEKEIEILENFAAQAVIAMENARLITETREALEQQTATAEVLQVINESPGNLTPVFDAVLEKAIRLCDSAFGMLATYDGHIMHYVAMHGLTPEQEALLVDRPLAAGQPTGRISDGENVVHLLDARDQDGYRAGFGPTRNFVDQVGARTAMWVALRKDRELLGILTIFRREVRAFTNKEIALVQNFAAQAVIAMENARLLDEIRQRQEELRITFENMGDGVAMFDETRLVAWNRKFQDILDLPDGVLAERLTFAEYIRYLAERGEYGEADPEEQIRRLTENADQYRAFERVRPDGRVIEIRHNPVPGGGFVLIYADITERKRSEAEIRAARDAAEEASRTIEAAYRDLKAAQANLIQAEKMASLGQLTAGIAHEIKNPLNFVNNFSALSTELIDELRDVLAPEPLGETARTEVDDLTALLKGNLEKVVQHGQRADGIVRSMLDHSRGSSGERRTVDLNALIDEALNLAYHGARAHDRSFNVTLERDFGQGIAPIEVNPQDITRVFLNIFANGFYATTKRARSDGDAAFVPTLKVTTRDAGEAVEIRVRDNGTGIPADIRDRLFQPFFTTKPTGEGTGLGLSITYDIVTQQHGGKIAVDSKVGEYSEFIMQLPRKP